MAEAEDPKQQLELLGAEIETMLIKAEGLFGPRDKSYSLQPVEFSQKFQPELFFLDHSAHIRLSRRSVQDIYNAKAELAHELVHFLAPLPQGRKSTVLEEGAATYFQKEYLHGFIPYFPEYERASNLIYELLKKEIVAIIELRRQAGGLLSDITKKMILSRYTDFPPQFAEELGSIFVLPEEYQQEDVN